VYDDALFVDGGPFERRECATPETVDPVRHGCWFVHSKETSVRGMEDTEVRMLKCIPISHESMKDILEILVQAYPHIFRNASYRSNIVEYLTRMADNMEKVRRETESGSSLQ
jgi:hypothetical protein